METMRTTTFSIVGLRHHDWQNNLHAHMSQAMGKRVLLMREDSNDWNREATAAYIDTLMVGYVANSQCREAGAYCDLSASQLLEGSVVAVDEEHRMLMVTVAVSDREPQLSDESTLYEQWEKQYHTVPMMALTADERRLLLLRRDLLFMLEEHRPYDGMMQHNLTVYEQLMAIDVSREAVDDRTRIIRLMKASTDADIRQWGRRLAVAVTTLGSPEARQQLAHYLFSELTATSEFHQMAQHHRHADLEEMERQLRLFPHRLYDEYLLSHDDFASKLYYRRIPQRPLRYFLSGLLLMHTLRPQHSTDEHDAAQQAAVGDALHYVAHIDHCAAAQWQERIGQLWQQLAREYAARISETHRAKNTTFCRRFVCQVVGTLLALGVYRQDVPQTEYTRLLEGSSRSSLRKDINQGVQDQGTRLSIRQMVTALTA